MHFRNISENDSQNGSVKTVYSCCAGEVIPLERLSNDVFSSMILGDGFGVVPSTGRFTEAKTMVSMMVPPQERSRTFPKAAATLRLRPTTT